MKLRAALYLAAAFLAAALALTVLPACSDESDFDSDTDILMDCSSICVEDCYYYVKGECRCVALYDDDGDPTTPDVCPIP